MGSTYYLVDHVFWTIGGATLAILRVFALGAYLVRSRAGGLGLVAMVVTVIGQALGLSIGGVTAFATNAIGRAYLAGVRDVMEVEFSMAMTATLVLVILLLVGNVLLGVAVWRSGTLPKWAGGHMGSIRPGVLRTRCRGRDAHDRCQPANAACGRVADSDKGGWIAWSALRRQSAEPVDTQAQPRVR